ncbi:MAG TPA: PRC-barrel domain-containing protein [Shinella sp.]|jgi:sporulation protein YlmC with PRC-barrel domain|uniref:PRC-barrel domain-containing protein n=1 Tax=Shinella sp. TaxID=1870904 RepID=UPI0029A311F4|nr:PRC-barrel domain-containing protein [Shinella sp.]MDX3972722.1 PRC-barrel domain-containing protein [Shinella sp.]HEV7245748.1 PRC-barrel domain-containing protein [Shinella sp.]
MTNKLLTSVAAGAIFLGAALAPAAYAQDTTQPAAGETQTMQKPAVTPGDDATGTTPGDTAVNPTTTPTDDTAQTPATGTQTQDTAETPATATEDTAQAPAAGGDYLTAQSPEQISANTYLGQAVYNSADESIGKISDLIMEKDGGITAAVVGVGGFLGIGEKWVAVPFEKISIAQVPDSDDVKLTTTETAESLQAAPEFKTTAQQVAERQANTPVDSSTTSSTTDTGTAPTTTQPAE